MRFPVVSILLTAAAVFIATSPASAGLQIGVGPSLYRGTEFDGDYGYGFNAEIGYIGDSTPIDLFLGVRATYVDGIGGGALASDLDVFDGSLVGRVLIPLGMDFIKFYGEGRAGLGNLSVSGDAKARGRINGREISVNSHFDSDDWTFGWGLGAGIQFDLGGSFGLRLGYEWTSYGEIEAFGLKMDPGSIHGATASIILKF